MPAEMKSLAREFGVVGAGGAGFPTHVKLDARVDIVVVNGAECEPLITVDQVLLLTRSAQLAAALEQVRVELGAAQAVIAIKEKHTEAMEAARTAVSEYPALRIHPLADKYPAGDEYVLVYEVTGRQIPHSGLPLDCGVVVLNVETLWNLHEAMQGRPVTWKWVTVAGEVSNPGTYKAPIGIRAREVIALAGGMPEDCALIDGGPMMGKLADPDGPVTKTTKALLILPKYSPPVLLRSISIDAILRQARSVCCQCQMCTDLCPRNLLGYSIQPNKTMLAAAYSWSAGNDAISQAYLCSECGACDVYACPMGLSPRRVNQMLKGVLAERKIPNPYKGKNAIVSQWREYRRMPTRRLIERLGIGKYHSPDVLIETTCTPERLVFPLRQHVGAPSAPVVTVGQRVEANALLADIPEKALGSRIFTALSGVVEKVDADRIVLRIGE